MIHYKHSIIAGIVLLITACNEVNESLPVQTPIAHFVMHQPISEVEKRLQSFQYDVNDSEYDMLPTINIHHKLDAVKSVDISMEFDEDELVIFKAWYKSEDSTNHSELKKWFIDYYHLDTINLKRQPERDILTVKKNGYKLKFSNPYTEHEVFYFGIYDEDYLKYETNA